MSIACYFFRLLNTTLISCLLFLPWCAGASDIFVDPVGGSDSNGGSSPSDALKTITRAFTNAASGDIVRGLPGEYSESSGESFPLLLPEGVSLISTDGPAVTVIRDPLDRTPQYNLTILIELNPGQDFNQSVIQGFMLDGTGASTSFPGVAIYIGSYSSGPGVSPAIRGNVVRGYSFVGSSALWIYLESGASLSAIVDGNELFGNDAGIVVFLHGTPVPCLDRSVITNNVLAFNGIGIQIQDGGGFFPSGGTAETSIVNNTVTRNSLQGLHVLIGVASTAIVLQNNIFEGNGEYGVYEEMRSDDTSFAEIAGNCFFSNQAALFYDYVLGPLTTINEVNNLPAAASARSNIEGDPMFIGPGSEDFHIDAGSVCVDTATTAGAPTVDFEDDVRPCGPGIDIGADEVCSGVDLLRDSTVRDILPLDPPDKSSYLPVDPVLHNPVILIRDVQSPATDPDSGILIDTFHPLVFYRLWPPQGNNLKVTAESAVSTVRMEF
ncbi:DUF1565 domain-containing protein [Acidobacteriota bacterium]